MIEPKEIYSVLFYPPIKRRATYSKNLKGDNYHYSRYHDEIAEDCKSRCVYCDIQHNEIGYEGMVLDHFRPQKYFQELDNNPNNLVLSCPKCNRLKSDHWPAGTGCTDTHDGICGFIDPFIESMLNYFTIQDDGGLVPVKPPAQYLEKILLLNRDSRKKVRLLRILQHNIQLLFDEVIAEFDIKLTESKKGKLSIDEFSKFCEEHKRKLEIIRQSSSIHQ